MLLKRYDLLIIHLNATILLLRIDWREIGEFGELWQAIENGSIECDDRLWVCNYFYYTTLGSNKWLGEVLLSSRGYDIVF